MDYILICQSCKEKKLEQIGIKMTIGVGFVKVGGCSICNNQNQYLYTYKEHKD